jgi:1-acyl-sn-glycerol-3-phosphate acyltransferase|tara:strand:- start:561 stop:1331 length:771 start_codon:yes stop_codon:yes gene_type:complete
VPLFNYQEILKDPITAIVTTLLRVYKWLVVIPCLGISTAVFCSLAGLVSIAGAPNWASRYIMVPWSRLNTIVSMVAVDVEGRDKVSPDQSYIIAANHQSLYDIYALQGFTGIDVKWVMKKELRSVPFLGFACEKMGHIIIDRSNPDAAIRSINEAKDRVTNGISVIFFAEGTRSRDGNLLPFKKGAFKMAIDLQLPILPISIHGSRNVLPSDTMELSPGRIKMVFHDPIDTEGLGDDDIGDLLSRTRKVLHEALQA